MGWVLGSGIFIPVFSDWIFWGCETCTLCDLVKGNHGNCKKQLTWPHIICGPDPLELDCFSCHSLNGSDHHCEDKNVGFHEEFAKKCTLSAKMEVR